MGDTPVRGTAQMYRCPVCDGKGKVDKTLGWGGKTCRLCQGRCYLQRPPTGCPSCNGKGGQTGFLGLTFKTCGLCNGIKYLMDKPHSCPKCRATGQIKGITGFFSRVCDLCDGQKFLHKVFSRCIKCNFSSRLILYFKPCINCGGVGYSWDPQHLCPRCNATGQRKGNNCMLCTGSGVVHHDLVACAKCSGAGEVRSALSFLLGTGPCPTCNGQGYFTAAPSLAPETPTGPSRSGKRRRRSEGDELGWDAIQGGGEDGKNGGGEEEESGAMQRRVRTRRSEENKNRKLGYSTLTPSPPRARVQRTGRTAYTEARGKSADAFLAEGRGGGKEWSSSSFEGREGSGGSGKDKQARSALFIDDHVGQEGSDFVHSDRRSF